MMVAVPLELLASPLKNGRNPGDGDRSVLVIGGTEKIRTGGAVVFCKVGLTPRGVSGMETDVPRSDTRASSAVSRLQLFTAFTDR
jgi:hypothetical protein